MKLAECLAIALGAVTASLAIAVPSGEAVDYARDIAPLVAEHCTECHRPGGIAPFSLREAGQVSKRARQIAMVTQSRFMPPWLPSSNGPGYEFQGQRGLSDAQIQALQQWAAAGALTGEQEMEGPQPAQASDWPLGKPDLILSLAEPYTLPADGGDLVRTFTFPVRLDEDHFIKAIDFNVGNPRAVHHAAFLIDDTGNARMLDEGDPGPGYASMADIGFNLAGSRGLWSPAPRSRDEALLPLGTAWPLPNRCELSVEVHFNQTGKAEKLQPRIALYFESEPVQRIPVPVSLGASVIDIQPGERNYIVRDSFEMPCAGRLLSIGPRAHYVCKRITIEAALPQQPSERVQLLRIDDWDFNWQQQYTFATPGGVCLPEGTRIEVELAYDNSAENPRNPSHPPKRVRDGWKPTDEMGVVFLYMVPEERGGQEKLQQAAVQEIQQRHQRAIEARRSR